MNDMGEGALVVQYLIAETGLQAQENEGYLRLIKLRTFTATAFSKKRGQREEVREPRSSISQQCGEKTLSMLEGREKERERERESPRQRWRLCRRDNRFYKVSDS